VKLPGTLAVVSDLVIVAWLIWRSRQIAEWQHKMEAQIELLQRIVAELSGRSGNDAEN
jgi:hypothetical protein